MRKRIFLSYRRVEAKAVATRAAQYLRRLLPDEYVFLDTSSITAGHDFPQVLRAAVSQAELVIVFMGPGWIDIKDERQKRRLDDPTDFVRIEVQSSLESGKGVVPILLDGATMPSVSQLPSELHGLVTKQALSASSGKVEAALDRLISEQQIGLISLERLINLLKQYKQIAEWEPNLRTKLDRITQACSLHPYERVAGLLDLTIAGNAKHFLAFTTAGLYHTSVGTDGSCAFKALGRIETISLDERRSTIFVDNEGWNVIGTMEDQACALLQTILAAFKMN